MYVYESMCVCLCVYVCVCRVYTYIRTCTYVHTYIHTYIQVLDRNNPRHVRLFQELESLRRQRSVRQRILAALPLWLLPLLGVREQDREHAAQRDRLLRRANALYAEAVCDFDDARTALYCSYKWHSKYFKMVGIAERVLLLLMVFFLSGSSLKAFMGFEDFEATGLQRLHLDKFLTAVTTLVFLTISLLGKPFIDWQDGLIDAMCRFTNVCNAVVVFLASK